MISNFEYPNGRILLEIMFEKATSVLNSGDMYLHLKFKPSRNFPYNGKEFISIHNCYGNAEINGVMFSQVICPTFFRLSHPIPEFKLLLTPEKIKLIEDNRNNGNVKIKINLKTLFSLDSGNFYEPTRLIENDVFLFAEISKSDWIEKHLTTLKYFSNNESIIQLSNIFEHKDIAESIIKCRTNYVEGRYEEVLREAFTLVETIPNKLGYSDVKQMFNELQNNDEEYMRDKYKNLDKLYGGIKGFAHLSRHGKTEGSIIVHGHISKSDARFFLNTLEILIDYVLEEFKNRVHLKY